MKKILKILLFVVLFLITTKVNAATYYVTGDGVRVRRTPLSKDNIVGKLYYGDIIDVISLENGWYKIKFGNEIGYVTYRYVSIKEDKHISNTIAVLTKKISLKNGASSSSKTIMYIPKNGAVKVLKEKNGWSYVEYNEKVGYVKTNSLKKYTNENEMAVGIYTIDYSINSSYRKYNINKSAKSLNNNVTTNGSKFSFINVVGTSNYLMAPEFNSKSKVYGGGVSEVSTALYLAIRDAKRNGAHIDVTEQNIYGSKTPYAKLGEEAMIDLINKKDLAFINKSGKKIKIYSRVTDKNVSFVVSAY